MTINDIDIIVKIKKEVYIYYERNRVLAVVLYDSAWSNSLYRLAEKNDSR